MHYRRLTTLLIAGLTAWHLPAQPAVDTSAAPLLPDSVALFTGTGKRASFKKLVRKARRAEIVFFGELHGKAPIHALQLELARALYEKTRGNLMMGAEMYQRDDQLLINEWFRGVIREKDFEKEAVLWPNYKEDYRPLIRFAREHQIPFIATNVPRRYAAAVARKGEQAFGSFLPEARQYMAPYPFEFDMELPGYKRILSMGANHGMANVAFAQAFKDATMAHFILHDWDTTRVFLHFNGTYHTNHYEGIVWYIKKWRPKTKVLTIASVQQAQLDHLDDEHIGLADFIVVIPTDPDDAPSNEQ